MKQSDLTIKQSNFVEYFCNLTSSSRGNHITSYKRAGFKDGIGVPQAVSRLLKNDKIVKAIDNYQQKTAAISLKRQEISKEYALACLQETYDSAKKNRDITNQVACVRLMMQHNGMLVERLAVDLDDSRRIDITYRTQAQRIAAFINSGQLLLPVSCKPVSCKTVPQDVVGGDNQQPAIIVNPVNLDVNFDVNTIKDNGLQSNESDNPNATE